jgi:hypothetical protein
MSTIGKDTFGLNKTEFSQKVSRIVQNFRANSKLIGEAKEFVLRACRLTDQWVKMATDPEVVIYLRSLDIAGGRKVKMLSLERGGTKQPVPKQKLIDALYPPKKIATTATPEEKHYNVVKSAMRLAVHYQLKAFRESVNYPCVCSITGKQIRKGQKTDIDHCGISFSEIADRFVAVKGITYSDIALMGPPTGKSFKDKVLWDEWTHFHMANARYSLVCASANRSKGSSGYQTPTELYGSFKSEDPEDLSLDF